MSKDNIVEEFVEIVEEEVEAVEAPSTPSGVTKLVHADGRVAYAHESMIGAYKSAGFQEE